MQWAKRLNQDCSQTADTFALADGADNDNVSAMHPDMDIESKSNPRFCGYEEEDRNSAGE